MNAGLYVGLCLLAALLICTHTVRVYASSEYDDRGRASLRGPVALRALSLHLQASVPASQPGSQPVVPRVNRSLFGRVAPERGPHHSGFKRIKRRAANWAKRKWSRRQPRDDKKGAELSDETLKFKQSDTILLAMEQAGQEADKTHEARKNLQAHERENKQADTQADMKENMDADMEGDTRRSGRAADEKEPKKDGQQKEKAVLLSLLQELMAKDEIEKRRKANADFDKLMQDLQGNYTVQQSSEKGLAHANYGDLATFLLLNILILTPLELLVVTVVCVLYDPDLPACCLPCCSRLRTWLAPNEEDYSAAQLTEDLNKRMAKLEKQVALHRATLREMGEDFEEGTGGAGVEDDGREQRIVEPLEAPRPSASRKK